MKILPEKVIPNDKIFIKIIEHKKAILRKPRKVKKKKKRSFYLRTIKINAKITINTAKIPKPSRRAVEKSVLSDSSSSVSSTTTVTELSSVSATFADATEIDVASSRLSYPLL